VKDTERHASKNPLGHAVILVVRMTRSQSARAAMEVVGCAKSSGLGRQVGVRIAGPVHEDSESGSVHFTHAGNPLTPGHPSRPLFSPIFALRQPQTVNTALATSGGVGKQCGDTRAATIGSLSENNHDLEPIRQGPSAGYFSPFPTR
jgi:hypothetical protein